MNNLAALSEAGDLVQQVQQLRQEIKQVQDVLRVNPPANTSETSPPDTRAVSLMWAEELDAIDPPGEGEDSSSPVNPTPRAPQKVVEVSECTEQHLVRSFACMDNEECRRLTDSFALPKLVVTKTPELDKTMAAQCSRSTKSNDQALSRIQALNSNALSPLSKLLERLNKDDTDISTDQVGYTVESAITLLGNTFAQISMLCQQKVLEEYNKELLTFAQGRAQGREMEFLKAAPELFGPKFPHDATKHLDQLAALQKAKSSSNSTGSSSVFWMPPSYHSSHQPRQRPQPYSWPGKGGGGYTK